VKNHKTTVEHDGKKIEFVNFDKSAKVALDPRKRMVLSLSEQASR